MNDRSISLLKAASAAKGLGRGLGHALRGSTKMTRHAIEAAGDIGEGLTGDPIIGRAVGIAGLGAGTVYGAQKAKEKLDERRALRAYQRGLY